MVARGDFVYIAKQAIIRGHMSEINYRLYQAWKDKWKLFKGNSDSYRKPKSMLLQSRGNFIQGRAYID